MSSASLRSPKTGNIQSTLRDVQSVHLCGNIQSTLGERLVHFGEHSVNFRV
jgi:hypothetical protein